MDAYFDGCEPNTMHETWRESMMMCSRGLIEVGCWMEAQTDPLESTHTQSKVDDNDISFRHVYGSIESI